MRSGPSRIAAIVLVGIAFFASGASFRAELRGLNKNSASVRAIPRDHGRVITAFFGGDAKGFIDFVRRTVPPHDSIRIGLPRMSPGRSVLPWPPAPCDQSTRAGVYFWLAYTLAPRPIDCTAAAGWVVFFNARPGVLPRDWTAFEYRPAYIVWERPGS